MPQFYQPFPVYPAGGNRRSRSRVASPEQIDAGYAQQTPATTTSRPFGGNVLPATPMTPYQSQETDRRQRFLASVQASRTRKQTVGGTYASAKAAGVDDLTARRQAFAAGQEPQIPMIPYAANQQGASGPRVAASGSPFGYSLPLSAQDRARSAGLRAPNPSDQADAFMQLRDTMGDDEARRAVGYPTSQPSMQQPVMPLKPYESRSMLPSAANPSQFEMSEESAKEAYDVFRQQNPDLTPNAIGDGFANLMAKYRIAGQPIDGRALIEKWTDAPAGGNPRGLSVNERGGDLYEVPVQQQQRQPQVLLPYGAAKGGVVDDPMYGQVVVDQHGGRVGAPIGPSMIPAQPAPSPTYVQGGYRGYTPIDQGAQVRKVDREVAASINPAMGANAYVKPRSLPDIIGGSNSLNDWMANNAAAAGSSPQAGRMTIAPPNGSVPTITSRAAYDALPSGATYTDARTGQTKRKN